MSRIEMCCKCDTPTGRAGRADDSLFIDEVGPLCEECYDTTCSQRLAAERERFEEWCGRVGLSRDGSPTYCQMGTRVAWYAWRERAGLDKAKREAKR